MTEQPNSPQFSHGQSGKQTTRIYSVPKGEGEAHTLPYGTPTNDGYVVSSRAESNIIEDLVYITTSPNEPSDNSIVTKTPNKPNWTVDARTVEQPINQHKDYCYCWDHYIITKEGAEQDLWDTWPDDKDANYCVGETDIKWLHMSESVPEGWTALTDPSYPGLEFFLVPAPVIRLTIYVKRFAKAKTYLHAVGTIVTPTETFGYSDLMWLVTSASISEQDDYYVVNVEYTGAKEWDLTIYTY